jgi:hypothetical protein
MKVVGEIKRETTYEGQWITFLTKDVREADKTIHSLIGKETEVIIRQVKHKRSLDANSYYWTLVTKLADVLMTSNEEVHNLMLNRYSEFATDENGNHIFSLERDTDNYLKYEHRHLKPTNNIEDRNGCSYRWYVLLKGSSEMNSKEMSRLIEGVVSECHEVGIETMTPDELMILMQEWSDKNGE